ncbi:MAG: hypothetical protein QOK35_1130, partial [Pseudonocardiales bacterium]|nr:hypothetical protein [Pseudonocardiales bacterium]
EALAENAATDIWDDGVHRECSTDYHLIVLRSLVGAIANAHHTGLAVPPQLTDRTERACDFALHVQRPDGTTPAVADGDQGDVRPLLAFAGEVLDRPDLTWAATGGARGTPPGRRHVSFPVGGYHVQRSGWGEQRPFGEERWCLLDTGPVGDGRHGHDDQLSVEIHAGGHPLVVDPGRLTCADEGSGSRRWSTGTATRSTVTVDGLDRTPDRRERPRGPVGPPRLLRRHTAPGLDLLVARATSPLHEAVHTRTVLLVDDDYWLVHDRLEGTRPHRYSARWQLATGAGDATTLQRTDDQVTVRAPGLALVVPRGAGVPELADGWVSPEYGVRHPAPAVLVVCDGRARADLFTAIVPTRARHAAVRVAATCRDDVVRAWVQRPGIGTDVIRWSVDGTNVRRRREPR